MLSVGAVVLDVTYGNLLQSDKLQIAKVFRI